jgi:hypothetical protein
MGAWTRLLRWTGGGQPAVDLARRTRHGRARHLAHGGIVRRRVGARQPRPARDSLAFLPVLLSMTLITTRGVHVHELFGLLTSAPSADRVALRHSCSWPSAGGCRSAWQRRCSPWSSCSPARSRSFRALADRCGLVAGIASDLLRCWLRPSAERHQAYWADRTGHAAPAVERLVRRLRPDRRHRLVAGAVDRDDPVVGADWLSLELAHAPAPRDERSVRTFSAFAACSFGWILSKTAST